MYLTFDLWWMFRHFIFLLSLTCPAGRWKNIRPEAIFLIKLFDCNTPFHWLRDLLQNVLLCFSNLYTSICKYKIVVLCKSVHDCLFVYLGFFVSLENFSLLWRRHHCRWRASNFELCLALMAIEQWGFFNVPHLLRHGSTVYNGHLRGPVTLTPVAERLAVELSIPVFTTWVCRDRGSIPDLLHAPPRPVCTW